MVGHLQPVTFSSADEDDDEILIFGPVPNGFQDPWAIVFPVWAHCVIGAIHLFHVASVDDVWKGLSLWTSRCFLTVRVPRGSVLQLQPLLKQLKPLHKLSVCPFQLGCSRLRSVLSLTPEPQCCPLLSPGAVCQEGPLSLAAVWSTFFTTCPVLTGPGATA